MEFKIKTGDLAELQTPCLILGIFEKRKLSGPAEAVDKASGGRLSEILKRGDLDGESGRTLLLYDIPGLAAERLLLVGCGKRRDFTRSILRQSMAAVVDLIQRIQAGSALCTLTELAPEGLGTYLAVRDLATAAAERVYRYKATKEDKQAPKAPLEHLSLWVPKKADLDEAGRAAQHAAAIADGVRLAKDLANLPGNICTPTYLADKALELGGRYERLEAEILEESDMEELGMGALLSVSKGSRQPAKLILMHYRGADPDDKPVVLVGKGLTFDAGGISIKPAADMDEMKYDMAGGASVFGAVQAACDLALPINLVGVVPASENLPDGAANKPGDIIKSLSGQSVEILNTDAEGRLILCDALTYCERFEPALVVDVATLTGACVVALGKHASGLFTKEDKLAEEILAAGEVAADRAWRMPLWDDYQSQLDSNFADMANVGGREAGAITAACFLSRYTKALKWAHLDIAGTAWLGGKEKGATGRPVPLLVQLLLGRTGEKIGSA